METNAIQISGSGAVIADGYHEESTGAQVVARESEEMTTPATEGSTTQDVVVEEENHGAANMLFGALWCIGGIVVTVISYDAVRETGGHYFIAWGAVVYGGWQFLKGLFQVATNH